MMNRLIASARSISILAACQIRANHQEPIDALDDWTRLDSNTNEPTLLPYHQLSSVPYGNSDSSDSGLWTNSRMRGLTACLTVTFVCVMTGQFWLCPSKHGVHGHAHVSSTPCMLAMCMMDVSGSMADLHARSPCMILHGASLAILAFYDTSVLFTAALKTASCT